MSNLPDIQQHGTPEQLLAGLDAYITAAHAMLEAGDMVDLAGLDAVVDVLCARVVALTPEEGKPFADQFDALHARLGVLQELMVSTQAQLKADLEASNKRHKASRAYLKDNN